jgi:signal peptidase I
MSSVTVAVLGASLLAMATLLSIVIWLRRRFVVVDVEGNSMEPTVGFDDRLVVRRVRRASLRSGDIVVFERPYRDVNGGPWAWRPLASSLAERRWLIKRIAALPGDPAPPDVPDGSGAVPAEVVAVLGDNRDASIDSRVFGYVPLDRVLGVAVRRYTQDGPITAANRPLDPRWPSPCLPNDSSRDGEA